MRNKNRIKVLEIQVEYMAQYINIMNEAIINLIERADKQDEEKAANIDSGKWYKNS